MTRSAQLIRGQVRRADVGDAAALARLRAVLFEGTGVPAGDPDAPWRRAAEAWFRQLLAEPQKFAAFVADDPSLGPVSAACGICDDRPPGPPTLSPVRGYIFSVATDPSRRHRGYARSCMEAVLAWFHDDTAAQIVELKASPDGAALYAALGFRATDPTLRLTLDSA